MKLTQFLLPVLIGILGVSLGACSDDDDNIPQSKVPEAVVKTFNEMYPSIKNVEWDSNSGYYVADFYSNSFETEAWFNTNGSWAMTETDYDTQVSMLPMAIYNAFSQSQYANLIVDDASLYERAADSFCIIEVETQGASDLSLIYDSFGNLINTCPSDDLMITPTTNPQALGF